MSDLVQWPEILLPESLTLRQPTMGQVQRIPVSSTLGSVAASVEEADMKQNHTHTHTHTHLSIANCKNIQW